MPQAPLCFIAMPFGTRPDQQGRSIDFDAVYEELFVPAVRAAAMEPLRGDLELVARANHKPMHERLILADYAIADLTAATADALYEFGVRDAVRPHSTILVSADIKQNPFDGARDRVLPYGLDGDGHPARSASDKAALTKALEAARNATTGRPVYQLLTEVPQLEIDRLKTDLFREKAEYATTAKQRLATAREGGAGAVRAEQERLGRLEDVEAGVLVDLLLSYRATKAWDDMTRLVEAIPEPLRRTQLISEQYGLALNRAGRSHQAERQLLAVIADHGPSSETYGLLGRVYKDRWEAERRGSVLNARPQLEKAIDAYRRGFEADWRDAYPGINAVTLMEIREPGGGEQRSLVPVVAYSNRRRIESGATDYWDHATRLELGVIGRDRDEATAGIATALALVREPWEPEATAHNLSLIRESRAELGETIEWAAEIEHELVAAGNS